MLSNVNAEQIHQESAAQSGSRVWTPKSVLVLVLIELYSLGVTAESL